MELLRFSLHGVVRLFVFLLQCLDAPVTPAGTDRGNAMREVFYEVEDADGNIILVPEERPRT